MRSRIMKWGNGHGVRLSRQVLAKASIAEGDEVDVTVRGGAIEIRPLRNQRAKRKLSQLVAAIPSNYETAETDWGVPRGKEAW